ncbi:MAG: glycosyltransferase family 2 protein [Terriglobia bacterium]
MRARLESFGSPVEATCIRKYVEKLTAKQSPATRPSTVLQPTDATSTLLRHSGTGPFPKVSVIVPTYNRPRMLERAIHSVLAQSFRDYEIVVVNDGGDEVESMIQQWNRDRNIVYVRHASNLDRAAARNSAIRIARGNYIAYLDDDDVWYPDHLQTLVSYLEETGQKVAYTDADRAHQVLNEGIYVTARKDQPYSFDFDADQILVGNFIPILCLMHERDCLNEIGLFDESLTTNEDWDLWIRMSRRYPFGHLKKITCEFSWRTDGSSTTSRKREDFLRTLRVVYDKYRELVVARPEIQEAQKKRLQVEEQSLLKVSSRSGTRDHVLSGIPCESLLVSHPELAGTLDRVKRYLDEGRISLALKIAHKELGPHEEARQIIACLREQDLENQLAAVH